MEDMLLNLNKFYIDFMIPELLSQRILETLLMLEVKIIQMFDKPQ